MIHPTNHLDLIEATAKIATRTAAANHIVAALVKNLWRKTNGKPENVIRFDGTDKSNGNGKCV
jgi:hypothetical protein